MLRAVSWRDMSLHLLHTCHQAPAKSDDMAAAVPKALPIDREEGPMVDERADVGTAVVALGGGQRPDRYDVYITHDWGTDGAGRRAHERVCKMNEFLRSRGVVTWFDGGSVEGDVIDKVRRM